MKTRNIDIEHNKILESNLFRHVLLTAPTASELEKKIKEYEILLSRTITSTYRLSELALERDGFYHITPTGSYQATLDIHFSGYKINKDIDEECMRKRLKNIVAMETDPDKESHTLKLCGLSSQKNYSNRVLTFEVDSKDKIDDLISTTQRQLLDELIASSNVTNISFILSYRNKQKDKIEISIMANIEQIRPQHKKNIILDDNEK